MTKLISIEGIHFKYPDHRTDDRETLKNIDIGISEGEYVAIVGANGSGKSTLARMINALLLPDQGSVKINGLDTRQPKTWHPFVRLSGWSSNFLKNKSSLPPLKKMWLLDWRTLLGNMSKCTNRCVRRSKTWVCGKYASALLICFLRGKPNAWHLAGVLAIRPKCVIFDEATSMLDPLGRQTVLSLMQQIHSKGNTVIHITHSMEEAAEAARVIVLLFGEVVYDGTPAELFSGQYDLRAWHLELPPALKLIHDLKASGVAIPEDVHTIELLSDWLRGNYSSQNLNDPQLLG